MTSPRRTILMVVALVALAAALRLDGLAAKSLWGDEIWEAKMRVLPFGELLRVLTSFTEHPPLLFLLHSIGAAAGRGAFWVRLPDVLEGIAAVPLLYLLVRRHFGEVAAAAAAILLALSPLHLRHSQDATGYAAIPILILLSFAALHRAYRRGRRIDFALYAGISAAFLYSHYFAVLVLASQCLLSLGLLLRERIRASAGDETERGVREGAAHGQGMQEGAGLEATRGRAAQPTESMAQPSEREAQPPKRAARRFAVRQWIAAAAAGAIFLLWIPWLLHQPRGIEDVTDVSGTLERFQGSFELVHRGLHDELQNLLRVTREPWRTGSLVETALFLAGSALAILRGPWLLRGVLFAYAFLAVTMRLVVGTYGVLYASRYSLFPYPLLLVIGGAAAAAIARSIAAGITRRFPRRGHGWAVALVLAGIIAAGVPGVLHYRRHREVEPWNAVTRYLRESMGPDDWVLAGAGWGLPEFLAFYLDGDWTLDPRIVNPDYRPANPNSRVVTARLLLERVLDAPDPPDLTRARVWWVTTSAHYKVKWLRDDPDRIVRAFPGTGRPLAVSVSREPPGSPENLLRRVVRFLARQAVRNGHEKSIFFGQTLTDLETILVERCAGDEALVAEVLHEYQEAGWTQEAERLWARRQAFLEEKAARNPGRGA